MTTHNLLERGYRFFTEPTSAAPLTFMRIAVGLFALLQLLVLSPSFLDLYGSTGFIEWVISDELFRLRMLPATIDLANRIIPLGFTDQQAVLLIIGSYSLSLFLLVLGWRTRIMAVLAWFLHLTLNNTAIMFGYGVETFTHVSLFYLIFFPSAEYCALDRRAGRTGKKAFSTEAQLAIRLLQLHLCLVYFQAGIAKMLGHDWWTGEAIWRTVAQPTYAQFDMTWISHIPWFAWSLSIGTLLIETFYPIYIWPKAFRPWWLLGTIGLHAGIFRFMGLRLFATVMILLNLTAFGWSYMTQAWDWAKLRWPVLRGKPEVPPVPIELVT